MNYKYSDLSEAGELKGDELFAISQFDENGTLKSRKITLAVFLAMVGSDEPALPI